MVGPGEVDDTLEQETAEECTKFGKVERCVIHEVRPKRVRPGVVPSLLQLTATVPGTPAPARLRVAACRTRKPSASLSSLPRPTAPHAVR